MGSFLKLSSKQTLRKPLAFEPGFDRNKPSKRISARVSAKGHSHYFSSVLNVFQLLADKVIKSTDLSVYNHGKVTLVSVELLWVQSLQSRSQGLSSYRHLGLLASGGGKMRDPGNEVAKSAAVIGTRANKGQGMFLWLQQTFVGRKIA